MPEPAVIAAFIVSFTTILTVVINVFSARIARREDRTEKRQEWLRDKQIQDVEIIVPTLDKFLGDLSSCLEGLKPMLSNAYRDLNELSQSTENDLLSANIKLLNRFPLNYENEIDVLWRLDTERRTWFGFEAKRRSLWFDNTDTVEQELEGIGEKLRHFHLSVFQTTSKFRWIVERVVENEGYITDDDHLQAKTLKANFDSIVATWPEINATVLKFQKILTKKYKPGDLPNLEKDDGLLVKIARWTEKKLRQLLQLR